MESGHKVDQMCKQYDFTIKGAQVFAAGNEITRLSRPLQSRIYWRAISGSICQIDQVEDCSYHMKSSMGP
jgi:hypothetical protein